MRIFKGIIFCSIAAMMFSSCGNDNYVPRTNSIVDKNGDVIAAKIESKSPYEKCSQGIISDNGLAPCVVINTKDKTKRYFFIDKTGEVAIDIEKEFGKEYKCSGFSEGIAFICPKTDNSKVKAINEKGEILFEFNGTPISPYHKGIAVFRSAEKKYGIMDNKGKVILPAESKMDLYSENYLFGMMEFLKDGKWGIKNMKNEIILDAKYDEAPQALSANRFILSKDASVIDAEGKVIVPKGKYRRMFRDGNMLKFFIGDKAGWIDFDGKEIIAASADFAGPTTLFNNDRWAPVNIDDKFSFIDRTGKKVLDSKYSVAVPFFNDDLCIVILSGKDKNDLVYSKMNRKGELVGDTFSKLNKSTMNRQLTSYVKNWVKL